MKKVIAVFLAILTVFCSCSIAVFAADIPEETTVAESDEPTTRNIKTDDGKFVVPINFTQLKQAFVFKLWEKIITFILNLFKGGEKADESAATGISEIFSVIDERISQIDNDINAAQ